MYLYLRADCSIHGEHTYISKQPFDLLLWKCFIATHFYFHLFARHDRRRDKFKCVGLDNLINVQRRRKPVFCYYWFVFIAGAFYVWRVGVSVQTGNVKTLFFKSCLFIPVPSNLTVIEAIIINTKPDATN